MDIRYTLRCWKLKHKIYWFFSSFWPHGKGTSSRLVDVGRQKKKTTTKLWKLPSFDFFSTWMSSTDLFAVDRFSKLVTSTNKRNWKRASENGPCHGIVVVVVFCLPKSSDSLNVPYLNKEMNNFDEIFFVSIANLKTLFLIKFYQKLSVDYRFNL